MTIRKVRRSVLRELKSVKKVFLGCERVEVHYDSNTARLTLFVRVDEDLERRMFSLADGQYPLDVLMNHLWAYQALKRLFRDGQVVADSELFAATLAGIPAGQKDPEGGLWGTSIDEDAAVWHVPEVEHGTVHAGGVNWRTVMLCDTWPGIIGERADESWELSVVHVPSHPVADEEWHRIFQLSLGYNWVASVQKEEPQLAQSMAEVFNKALVVAQPL